MSERILVIQLARLGDCVQTLPVLKKLKEADAGREVTVLCLGAFGGILADSPWCDRAVHASAADYHSVVDEADPQRQAGKLDDFFRGFPALAGPFDRIVNFCHDRLGGGAFPRVPHREFSGLRHGRAGQAGVHGDWARYLFAHVQHRQSNTFNLVDSHLGMAGAKGSPAGGCLSVPARAQETADRLLGGLPGAGPLVALQLGANEPHRTWPAGHFAALAEALAGRFGARIVLLGTAAEASRARWFASKLRFPYADLMGKTSVLELAAVLGRCAALVSNDTGTIHLAAVVGTRCVGIYFSTAWYAETSPYGEGHLVLAPERPCCPCWAGSLCAGIPCRTDIAVDDVLAAVANLLPAGPGGDRPGGTCRRYRSRFLANGSLAYLPDEARPPLARDVNALLQRTGWERVLGLDPDPAVPAFLEEALGPAELAARRAALRRACAELAEALRAEEGKARQWGEASRKGVRFADAPAPDAASRAAGRTGADLGLLGTFCDLAVQDLALESPEDRVRQAPPVFRRLVGQVEAFAGALTESRTGGQRATAR